jgi:hypothetical protein
MPEPVGRRATPPRAVLVLDHRPAARPAPGDGHYGDRVDNPNDRHPQSPAREAADLAWEAATARINDANLARLRREDADADRLFPDGPAFTDALADDDVMRRLGTALEAYGHAKHAAGRMDLFHAAVHRHRPRRRPLQRVGSSRGTAHGAATGAAAAAAGAAAARAAGGEQQGVGSSRRCPGGEQQQRVTRPCSSSGPSAACAAPGYRSAGAQQHRRAARCSTDSRGSCCRGRAAHPPASPREPIKGSAATDPRTGAAGCSSDSSRVPVGRGSTPDSGRYGSPCPAQGP